MSCIAIYCPLLDGRHPLEEILADLEGTHAAADVRAAIVSLAAKGYVVSAIMAWTDASPPTGLRLARPTLGGTTASGIVRHGLKVTTVG